MRLTFEQVTGSFDITARGFTSMQTEETRLRLLDSRLASRITQARERDCALRLFAHHCATFAIQVTDLKNGVLNEALRRTSKGAQWNNLAGGDDLAKRVSNIVEQLDESAFNAQDAADRGNPSDDEYTKAFRAARAATSVLASLDGSALVAAIDACYEAYHATADMKALVDIAEKYLKA